MKARWTVIWRGKNCVTYLRPSGDWTLDPDEAEVFVSWVGAKLAAFGQKQKGVEAVRCWV
jgi:hypothetical protein